MRDYSTNYSSNYSIRFRVSTYPAIFKYYSKNPCFSAAAKFTVTDEMTRVISARDRLKWGTFGPLFLLKRHGDLSIFKTHTGGEHARILKKKKKEKFDNVFSLRNNLKRKDVT